MAGVCLVVLGLVGCGETADYPSNPKMVEAFERLEALKRERDGGGTADVEVPAGKPATGASEVEGRVEPKLEPEVVEEKKPKKLGFWARLFGGGKVAEKDVEGPGDGDELVELVKIDKDAALSTQFKQACRAAADDASGGSVRGNGEWYFSEEELEALASGNASLTAVAAVAEYSRQLRRRGIQLVVVPVPPKAVVYPDEVYPGWKLSSRKVERFDGGLMTLYAELRSRGVDVVDMTEGMIERRNAKTGRMYPKTDGDWSARACELAAAAVADKVQAVGWATGDLRVSGITASETTQDLRGDLAGTGTAAETVAVRAVRQNGAAMESLGSAPLLVIGDGNALTYRSGGGGIADQLAAELRVAFELAAADGPGRNVPRSRVLRKTVVSPGYWERKRCVVWVLNGSEFLRGDWQQVPVSLALQEGEEELRSEGETGF